MVNDTPQAVVEPASGNDENGGGAAGTPAGTAAAELTVRRQSAAENSGFRKLRLENEQYRKKISELEDRLCAMSGLKKASDAYLSELVDSKMRSDLEQIQRLDPTVSDLDSLGENFLRLIENGIDAKTAFAAVKAASAGAQSPKQPETGAVGNTENADSEFFSSRELDRLTSRDLDNPLIFKKAMKSLKRLK